MLYILCGYSVIIVFLYRCSFHNYTIVMGIFISLYCGILLPLSFSEEKCFCTVENNEHTKEIYFSYKRMIDYHFEGSNDCHFERSNKMSFLILQLINHYIIYNANYLSKQLNVYAILQSNIIWNMIYNHTLEYLNNRYNILNLSLILNTL